MCTCLYNTCTYTQCSNAAYRPSWRRMRPCMLCLFNKNCTETWMGDGLGVIGHGFQYVFIVMMNGDCCG